MAVAKFDFGSNQTSMQEILIDMCGCNDVVSIQCRSAQCCCDDDPFVILCFFSQKKLKTKEDIIIFDPLLTALVMKFWGIGGLGDWGIGGRYGVQVAGEVGGCAPGGSWKQWHTLDAFGRDL
jgi:hypothetical protein